MRKIAIIPGDGIGVEVTAEAVKVLNAVIDRSGLDLGLVEFELSAEKFLNSGVSITDEQIEDLRQNFDGILIGALGDPRVPDDLYTRKVLSNLRLKLNLYVNLMPVILYDVKHCPLKDKRPEDVNFVVVRHNLEGPNPDLNVVFKKGTPDEEHLQHSMITRKGIRQIIQYAFEYARKQGRKRVTICSGRCNMRLGTNIWSHIFDEVGQEYADIEKTNILLEDLVHQVLTRPEEMDVVVPCSMFGNVIADLGIEVQGGMGLAFEGHLNPGKLSLYMPAYGSCAGGLQHDVANPLGSIAATVMMLNNFGFEQEASWVDKALKYALETDNTTSDLKGRLNCSQVGDFITDQIKRGRSNNR
ncbi:3-isopropylmalate dehydrogenase [candidate division LCP-89 bacterium B3_LCP]|uniref:3-isopropylmalate dehydrogenase n=1 Tax=candidate division LCP-89 bacterium B3_LCP TaxID=2012998 RepID=A0A532UYP7_UNCL8|nr:MAG: 3-isopropylmalate dehydrogenase [candidate division LCP-89 bacterium B3_LCP]